MEVDGGPEVRRPVSTDTPQVDAPAEGAVPTAEPLTGAPRLLWQ